MLTPIPGNGQLTIKINEFPITEETENKRLRFFLEYADRIFSVTVKPKTFKKLTEHDYENWIAVIAGGLGPETDGVIELTNPGIQIFEKKLKELKDDKPKTADPKTGPLQSPDHPNAVIAGEEISGEIVTELIHALGKHQEKLPEFQYIPLTRGFVCRAEVPKIGAVEVIASSKKQAKNWAAKQLLEHLKANSQIQQPKAQPKISNHVTQIIDKAPDLAQGILKKSRLAISNNEITIYCINQAERLVLMKYTPEIKNAAQDILGTEVTVKILESQLEKTR